MKYQGTVKAITRLLLLFIYFSSLSANAQGIQRISQHGLEFSYGFHHFMAESNNFNRERYVPSARGFALGYFMGNSLIKMRIRGFGFYESTNNALSEFSGCESEILLNFYPLEFLRTHKNILDVYFFSGLDFAHVEFANKSIGYDGKESILSHVVGIGTEVIIRKNQRAVFLFTEISAGNRFNKFRRASDESKNPIPELLTSVNIGIRYAIER
jgi:hypothetical protein